MKTIGIIGTGIMGNGMALNFLKKDYTVHIWNRTKAKTKQLRAFGAIWEDTPKEVTQRADIIFEVTADDKTSKNAWLGKNGILAGANKNKTLITSATLSIDWIEKLNKECKKKKLALLDMPLTGSRQGAESGTMTLLIGGNKNTIQKIKKELNVISSQQIHFGPTGNGMKFKLILNTIQATHVAALGEALTIAKIIGLNIKMTGNTLSEKPGGTATKMTWRDYQKEPNPINFALEWITKDLEYAKKLSKEINTPFLDATLKLFKQKIKNKKGKKDWTQVTKN